MPWIHAWRRCVTGNQVTKVPGSHGARGSYDKGRYGYGYPEAPPLEDERGHAPRALETPGGHIGELSEVPLSDEGPPRLPDLRNLRGPRRHEDRSGRGEIVTVEELERLRVGE